MTAKREYIKATAVFYHVSPVPRKDETYLAMDSLVKLVIGICREILGSIPGSELNEYKKMGVIVQREVWHPDKLLPSGTSVLEKHIRLQLPDLERAWHMAWRMAFPNVGSVKQFIATKYAHEQRAFRDKGHKSVAYGDGWVDEETAIIVIGQRGFLSLCLEFLCERTGNLWETRRLYDPILGQLGEYDLAEEAKRRKLGLEERKEPRRIAYFREDMVYADYPSALLSPVRRDKKYRTDELMKKLVDVQGEGS